MQLDRTDIIILRELMRNSRKSYVDLAEDCGITKCAVAKRFNEMKKKGIICGSTIQYNYPKFGYTAVASLALSVASKDASDLQEGLRSMLTLPPQRSYASKYNFIGIARLQTLKDLESLKERITRKFHLQIFRAFLWTDVINSPENILPQIAEKQVRDEYNVPIKTETTQIDELSQKIVDNLILDSRISFSVLAKKLETSIGSITRRYEYLTKGNCIKATIQVNPRMLGYQGILHLFISVRDLSTVDNVAKKIAKIQGVTWLAKISGEYDLQVATLIRDIDDIMRVQTEVEVISGTQNMDTDIIKIRPFWPGRQQYITTF
jgi:Lrp/AsnC family transcriptional regulator for asnA, asnC and gidA